MKLNFILKIGANKEATHSKIFPGLCPFLREKALGTRLHDFNFASPLFQLFEVFVFCQPVPLAHPPNDESLSPDKFSGEVSTKLALETSLAIK